MVYRSNPFLERMSERTTSDQEFVHLFSPKILEKLQEDCFGGAVHVFRSPPGGGKTTILRAFTPNALRAFWYARPTQTDSYRQLVDRGVLDDGQGPQLLGILLSCASGYADLPAGASAVSSGIFRALLDCRTVLRTLRSLGDLIGTTSHLGDVRLEYGPAAADLRSIPRAETVPEMLAWAERREREIYADPDDVSAEERTRAPTHVRFESITWLQSVTFKLNERVIAPKRLLMIDDIQKLRKSQRVLLLQELVDARPAFPIWLASRTIAFAGSFLGQGVREGRDIRDYPLEELWGSGRGGHQFVAFAQNILDRRFALQSSVPGGSFSQYLAEAYLSDDLIDAMAQAMEQFRADVAKHKDNFRYSEWLARAEKMPAILSLEPLIDLYTTRILIARDMSNRQPSLDLAPLTDDDLDDRDSSAVQGAAEIFLNKDLKLPYYFGIERLCALASNNVEELLGLAAALFEGMKAKQILRRQNQPQLSPGEQEKRLKEAAARKREFIPKSHSDGSRAQRLLDAVGLFCREKTFLPNAPYAPGVTGVRLSDAEIEKLRTISSKAGSVGRLDRVIFECVAENLLLTRPSKASASREAGTVFYLNRTLCAHYGLPVQYGGWQDVSVQRLAEWCERGLQPGRTLSLEIA